MEGVTALNCMKRLFCLALVAALLVCCVPVTAHAEVEVGTDEDTSMYPVIQMRGSWTNLMLDAESANPQLVFNLDGMEALLAGIQDELLADVKALDFDAAVDGLIRLIWDWMGPIRMDENGESIIQEEIRGYGNGLINNNRVIFSYDWRQDPLDSAVDLHEYVQYIRQRTGAEKVNIVGISGSGQVLLSYLKLYGYDDVASAVFNISMQQGTTLFGKLATRDFSIDADALSKTTTLGMFSQENLQELAQPWLSLAYEPGLLSVLLKFALLASGGVLDRVYDEALIPLLFMMPGIWSYVPAKDYEAAKRALLKGDPKYDKLVKKLDRYHSEVMEEHDEIMRDIAAHIKVGVRVGYGFPLAPVVKGAMVQSDTMVDTVYASFGATCAPLDSKFPTWYKQKIDDGHDHISPDRMIDASTCLLPERTWFAYNHYHHNQIDYSGWYDWFLRSDNATVEGYPQFTAMTETDVYGPLEVKPTTWVDTLAAAGLWLLKAWRWLLLLPLFWI